MQAMIFAAGMGTRLKPITDILPKALVPVSDKPLIQHVLDKMVAAGVKEVVVNVHHHAEQLKNFISLYDRAENSVTLRVSDESDALLETGGGIKRARQLFNGRESVLIHNCDILSNVNLTEFYSTSNQSDAAATLLVSERRTQRYLLFNAQMRLVGWTNITTGEVKSPYAEILQYDGKTSVDWQAMGIRLYAFSGIHCISPRTLNLMDEWPERFPIMDFYLKHCAEIVIRGTLCDNLRLLDVGKLDTLAEAEEFLNSLN